MKAWEKIFHTSRSQNKVGIAILTSNKVDFKPKYSNKRYTRSLYKHKGTNSSRSPIINIYAPNITAPNYGKQMASDLEGETDNTMKILGDYNSPLQQWIDHPQKIDKEILNPSSLLVNDPAIPLLGIYPKEMKIGSQRETCIPMLIATLFTIAKIWK